MRLHFVRHVSHEGLGLLEPWARRAGMRIDETRPFAGQPFPDLDDVDWLIVLGGPMGACDQDEFPWLADELDFMRRYVDAGTPVLGICLGAQLLARVLGAPVRRHLHPEIGWHRIAPTAVGKDSVLEPFFGPDAEVMQWHYDTFDLPAGAVSLATSVACENQAFEWGENVLGLQFHPEMTRQEVRDISVINGDWPAGEFVQETEEMLEPDRFERLATLTDAFLDRYAARYLRRPR